MKYFRPKSIIDKVSRQLVPQNLMNNTIVNKKPLNLIQEINNSQVSLVIKSYVFQLSVVVTFGIKCISSNLI